MIVIKDASGSKGWNYKHIIPRTGLTKGDTVNLTTILGTVAPALNANFYPDHLHLDRGDSQETTGKIKGWFKPNLNPLSHFESAITSLDGAEPTIEAIRFRLQEDDKLASGAVKHPFAIDGNKIGGDEKPRNNARYFTNTVRVQGIDHTHLGKKASASATSGANSAPDNDFNSLVDIIAQAYDQFADGNTKLNVYKMSFLAFGKAIAVGFPDGGVTSFELDTLPAASLINFLTLDVTRSLYENDTRSNTVLNGPFQYIVTNTENQSNTNNPLRTLLASNTKKYWNTNARMSESWNSAIRARENADAEFPDDLYTVRVYASDQAGNQTFKTEDVLVQNYVRNVSTDKNPYLPGETVKVTGGSQYYRYQTLKIFLMPATTAAAIPPNETAITGHVLNVETDEKGVIQPGSFILNHPPGDYWLIVDYNGDEEFTRQLDAAKRITISPVPMVVLPPPENSGTTISTGATGPIALDPLENAHDPLGSPLDVLDFTQPAHGTITFENDLFVYTPEPGYAGTVSFTYTLITADGRTVTVTITFIVVNCIPTARDDIYTLPEDGSIIGDVRLNDYDCDDETLIVSIVSYPDRGYVELLPDQRFSYTPEEDFNGWEAVGYEIIDSKGARGYAYLYFDVEPVNDAPVAAFGQSVIYPGQTLNGDLRNSVVDPDGDTLNFELVSSPPYGTLTLNPDGTYAYVPQEGTLGAMTFDYRVSDAEEITIDGSFTIYINAVPVATDDSFEKTNYFVFGNVLANDTDENVGEALSAVVLTPPSVGHLTFLPSGLFIYDPVPNVAYEETFTYELRDSHGGASIASVLLNVTDAENPDVLGGVSGNGGDAQRSRLTTITLDFESPVDADSLASTGAITLTRTAALNPSLIGTRVETGAAQGQGRIFFNETGWVSRIILFFDNAGGGDVSAGVEYGSLADGRWLLTIPSLGYHSTVGDTHLRRLFGDIDNNGTVDGQDYALFGAAFGSSVGQAHYRAAFDFDNNGVIDGLDFAQFGNRFGLTL